MLCLVNTKVLKKETAFVFWLFEHLLSQCWCPPIRQHDNITQNSTWWSHQLSTKLWRQGNYSCIILVLQWCHSTLFAFIFNNPVALSVSKVRYIYITKWNGNVNNFLTMSYSTYRCSRHSLQYYVKMFSYSPTKIISVEHHLPNTAENITSTFRVAAGCSSRESFFGLSNKVWRILQWNTWVSSPLRENGWGRASYSHEDTLHNRHGHSKSVWLFCWSPARSDLLHCVIRITL